MKSFKKILGIAATSALALTLGAFALTGCGGGKNYTFEAEEAVLFDPATAGKNTMKIQDGVSVDSQEDVTLVGYFATPGQTITWNVTAAADCTVTLKLGASSTSFDLVDGEGEFLGAENIWGWMFGQQIEGFDQTTAKGYLAALDAADCGAVLKVNDSEVGMSGTLPSATVELEGIAENRWAAGAVYSIVNCGELTAKINLKKGENKIVLEVVTGGLNVDKITIKSKTELTFAPTDNSDRIPSDTQG